MFETVAYKSVCEKEASQLAILTGKVLQFNNLHLLKMKFLLSFTVFFMLTANLLEVYGTTGCRDGPGVLKLMHVKPTSDCQTGSYYRIEGTQANEKNWAINLRQYRKGNPWHLEEVNEFEVQSCRQAEEAVHRAIIRNGEFKVVENNKWYYVSNGDQEKFVTTIKAAVKAFKQGIGENLFLSILEAMIEGIKTTWKQDHVLHADEQ